MATRLQYEPINANPGSSFFCRSVQGAHFGFGWHHHPEVEVAWVLKGRGTRYVGDAIRPFADGDLVLLGPDLPHTWVTDPADGPVASKVIQFLPTVFGGLLEEAPELRPIKQLLVRSRRGLQLRGATRDEVERLFLRIIENRSHTWRQVVDLVTLLGTILESQEVEELASAVPETARQDATDPKIDEVLAVLQGPPDQIPSQAEVAARLRFSPASFSRFFKSRVGRTYVALAGEVRLLHACRELIETDRPIIDIALRAGFENLSNFNRRFRAFKGMTPREFRAQARQSERITGPERAN